MKSVHYVLATTIGVASLSLLAGCGGGGGNPSVSSSAVSSTLDSQTRVVDPYPKYIAGPDAIPNSYIVMLKNGAIGGGAAARTTTTAAVIANPVQVAADDLVATYGGTVDAPLEAINQFTANMTIAQAQAMSNDSQVDMVIANCPVYETGQRIINNPYASYSVGLDLVDQQVLATNGIFNYVNTGSGVHVYVMDSGIKVSHQEFQGKFIDGRNFQNDRGQSDITDDNGHGTAVASIVAGKVVGVAPDVNLHALRIAKQVNGAWTSDQTIILKAINWLMQNKPTGPIVLNCSFGTQSVRKNNWPYPTTTNGVDSGIRKLANSGVIVVASAGNGIDGVPINAEKNSPGGTVGELIVVGAAAENSNNNKSSYSNYGNRVDIFACADTTVANAYPVAGTYRAFNGTSATAPLVAGTVALYLQTPANQTKTQAQVEQWLIGQSSKDILNASSLNGSPNRMLYKGNL
jgi:subtilisin family serine protease